MGQDAYVLSVGLLRKAALRQEREGSQKEESAPNQHHHAFFFNGEGQ